ncbi:DUF6350 family protein [Pseudokineococcus lusitanus]|uniref:Uncharacterized protein n=1 Tax=Pseudokineococcus lusitanus TaxID=763993 RepID=A0A3N1HKT2_9ACTN|nr:DUF6350 family protein [Pseudokineococcus lusitanus]ROP43138.1 hypothetical protein EDC03_1733 [Pseudokineococcus lusitanus]
MTPPPDAPDSPDAPDPADDRDGPGRPGRPRGHDAGATPPPAVGPTTDDGEDDSVVVVTHDDAPDDDPDDADGDDTDDTAGDDAVEADDGATTSTADDAPAGAALARSSDRPASTTGSTPASRRAAAAAAERAPAVPVVTDDRGRTLLTSPVLIGLLAGAQAVLGSLLCVVAPVVATWLVAAQTGATWDDAVRVAADGWLLAHGTGLAVEGGRLGLWPLGLALVPLAWYVSAGRRTAVALEATHPAADARRDGLDGALLAAVAGVVVAAAALAAAVALVAGTPAVRPGLASALGGAALLSGLGAGLAMAAARLRLAGEGRSRGRGRTRAAGTAPRSLRGALADLVRLPRPARPAVGAGARALLWSLVGAAAVLVVSLGVGAGAVADLHRALDAGVVGGAVLLAGQLLLLPTALVWALSWVAGPGFAVGAGTSVGPGGTELGVLPALPLLGGLPQQGTGGGWLWVVLVLPVAAGAVASLRMRRACVAGVPEAAATTADGAPVPLWRRVGLDVARRARGAALRAPVVGLVAGGGAGALAAASSGPVGPGALAVVGPVWWQVALSLGGLVTLGALLTLLAPAPRRGTAEAAAPRDDVDGAGAAPAAAPVVPTGRPGARPAAVRAPRPGAPRPDARRRRRRPPAGRPAVGPGAGAGEPRG